MNSNPKSPLSWRVWLILKTTRRKLKLSQFKLMQIETEISISINFSSRRASLCHSSSASSLAPLACPLTIISVPHAGTLKGKSIGTYLRRQESAFVAAPRATLVTEKIRMSASLVMYLAPLAKMRKRRIVLNVPLSSLNSSLAHPNASLIAQEDSSRPLMSKSVLLANLHAPIVWVTLSSAPHAIQR